MPLKFIDTDPPTSTDRRKWGRVRAELRDNPGQWAEVTRAPKAGAGASKVNNDRVSLASRYEDIEAVTRVVGEDRVLYARAVTP